MQAVKHCQEPVVNVPIQDVSYEVVFENQQIPLESLRFKLEDSFQREATESRIRDRKKSLMLHGWFPAKQVTINTDFEVVDGQARTRAAFELGWPSLPCCMLKFATPEDEAYFYDVMNTEDAKSALTPIQSYKSKVKYKDLLATTVSRLEQDRRSLLYDNVRIPGQNTSYKFNVNEVYSFILTAIDGPTWYNKKRHETAIKYISKLSYEQILLNVNELMFWLYGSYGKNKSESPALYSEWLNPIMSFYRLLKKQGFLSTQKKVEACIAKNSKFTFVGKMFSGVGTTERLVLLASNFNSGRQKKLDLSKGV